MKTAELSGLPTPEFYEQRLQQMGAPVAYPVKATFFSERVQGFAKRENIETVAQLCGHPLVIRSPKRTGIKNFGPTSLREIQLVARSIVQADTTALQQFVPIRKNGGIDLGIAARAAAGAKGFERLKRRFVELATLAEAGADANTTVTRERVRQVEETLLETITILLGADVALREQLWNEWRSTGSVAGIASDAGVAEQQVANAAVAAFFARAPEGIEYRTSQFAASANVARLLRKEPLFYSGEIHLTDWLQSQPAAPIPSLFLQWNRAHQLFTHRADTDTLVAQKPKAKHVVAALLSNDTVNQDRILAFLKRVKRIGTWTPKNLWINYRRWRSEGDFPQIDLDRSPDTSPDTAANQELAAIDVLAGKPTERAAVYMSRIGQGRFRDELIKNRRWCHATQQPDVRFLRASHIKRWCDSENPERLDWRNGLLLSPNYDLLFELALITFENDGSLRIAPDLPPDVTKAFSLDEARPKNVFCEKTKEYLAHHHRRFEDRLKSGKGSSFRANQSVSPAPAPST